MIMLWIFWLSILFIAYTLAGYAACLWLLSRLRSRRRICAEILPSVSVLIVVRGAENLIESKILNCLEQEYPRDKLEIAVVCDGPAPSSEEIVLHYEDRGVRLFRSGRQGKTGCLKMALDGTSGEIVLFTDVAVRMNPDAIRTIVSNFADSTVGCVSSEDATSSAVGNAEPIYISFDAILRRLEGEVCSLINVSGSLFAARRVVCKDWPERISSDFFVPLHSIEAGYKVVVDARVPGYLSSVKVSDEFPRKVRTIVHGLDVFFTHLRFLNPFVYGLVSWELVSHKLFRWLLPFGFIAALLSNCLLWNAGVFYRVALAAQVFFHLAGIIPRCHQPLLRFMPFKIASFFMIGNLSTLKSWLLYSKGERFQTWEPSRR
jgi:glycosyltransferase involved in cell wall biosynthesis